MLSTLCTPLRRSLRKLSRWYLTKLAIWPETICPKYFDLLLWNSRRHVQDPRLVKQLPSSVPNPSVLVTLKDAAHVSTNKTTTLLRLQPDVHKSNLPPASRVTLTSSATCIWLTWILLTSDHCPRHKNSSLPAAERQNSWTSHLKLFSFSTAVWTWLSCWISLVVHFGFAVGLFIYFILRYF